MPNKEYLGDLKPWGQFVNSVFLEYKTLDK